jgi:hypothetical protein
MPVEFKEHHLRLAPPTLVMPGKCPDGFHPISDKSYPTDLLGRLLIETIARKGWDVPGIRVTFTTRDYPIGPFAKVEKISGGEPNNQWYVYFGRPEFSADNRKIYTTASKIATPGQTIELYSDHSGPSLVIYAGNDYLKDEEKFLHGFHLNAKAKREPKIYLKYTGHGANMVAKDNYDEYAPEPSTGEERVIPTQEMFDKATRFLTEVIKDIEKFPDHAQSPEQRFCDLSHIELLPAPPNMPSFYVVEDPHNSNTNVLVVGNGQRLCSVDIQNDPNQPFPQKAYDGFSYGYPSFEARKDTRIPCMTIDKKKLQTYEVTLRHANDIYVVDEAAAEGLPYGDDSRIAIARTLIPLNEYQGNFAKPVFLIERPLGANEAQNITQELAQHRVGSAMSLA